MVVLIHCAEADASHGGGDLGLTRDRRFGTDDSAANASVNARLPSIDPAANLGAATAAMTLLATFLPLVVCWKRLARGQTRTRESEQADMADLV